MQSRKRHAQYRTACSECSRIKSRCIATSPGSPCERCQRLGKECVASNNKRKQKSAASDGPSQSGQLEAKIDGLVSLITNNAHAKSIGTVLSSGNISLPATPSPQADSDLLSYVIGLCSSIKEDNILSNFTQTHHPHLSFLSLPSDQSPSSLRQERPFLWLGIVAVSQAHALPQAVLNDKIRCVVAQRMVLNLERSLELLQGLLICIAWGNFQVNQRPFLTLFTQLANTVVFDLGLNQPPQTIPEAMLRLTIHRPWVSAARTAEQQRAVIACYCLSSVVSSYMRRTDKLLWTLYLGTCLQDLSTTNVSRDLTLVSMVKTRQVLEKAFYSPPSSHTSAPKIPADFVAAMLHTELDKFCASPAENPNPQHLHKTYQALEFYFKIFLAFQPIEYHGFTLAELYQLVHATLSTRKLVLQLTTGAYDERRVGRLESWYQQARNNLKDASTSPGAKADGRAAVFGKLAGMLETFGGGEMEASRHPADNGFDMGGVASDMVPGEDWLEVMDQFGWTF